MTVFAKTTICVLSSKFVVWLLVVSVVAFCILSVPTVALVEATEAEAKSAIDAAQEELVVCYEAIANASGAGANVSDLILVLDLAGGNLSKADLAYKTGDFASAQSYAVQSLNLLVQNNVKNQANALMGSASNARLWDFMINVAGSLIGAFVVACSGFIVWTFLKKREVERGSVTR